MEPAAAWGPCEFQLANWTIEEPAVDEVWAPAASLPVEYASIDIFPDIWSLQSYVPSSSSGGQHRQVVYNSYAAATQHDNPITEKAAPPAQEPFEVDLLHDMEMEILNNNPIRVFEEATRKFEDDMDMVKMKIHRYPPSIQGINEWYTVPTVVAIGPYHHGKRQLKQSEKVKHAAAYHCIKNSGRSVQEMYQAVVSVVLEINARRLYDNDVMEGIGDDKFLPMMFFDACFLVTYMLKMSRKACDTLLRNFLESNAYDIDHDIMLLENQIPWPVVDAIMKYTPVPLAEFVTNWKDGCLQDRVVAKVPTIVLDDSYKPPHLLGLLRFYIVGRRSKAEVPGLDKMKSIAISVSAVELTEMGISFAANETTQLVDIGLTKEWIYFAKLSMAPLSLNDLRASLLVNMAAHELCTTPDFFDDKAGDEDSAVCSYLLLLCMLMNREDDVQHLRTSGILEGGAGLSNKQALDFFTGLQSLRIGRCYGCVMAQIESYRITRPLRIKVYAFLYNNWKAIVGVGSVIGVLASILRAIKSLNGPAH
ncbi:hypothetical protein SEVIR_8G053800v4 [Setaria viridis]|uniref:Uncharacterized protein n=1 Tax=Setaria viridis TaxID=4556 RepID=A0A4U6TFS8_SETVI|nr:UPF0481 protein At3g47200-like [Setaria viridis]XP_034606352.1 UPF0481 protein At3g47200-like [Setaria viridis]XP_034606353.1 UPF0481 protein At3g47200-like [Setaria viridis]XP_034606354.1 UPF0481 protein At3g47200-like [Setaria viridis]TKV99589.1 hypothetical protein SEVIR_8G053800v2 [Setaria viridis]TKV99591.1 hypothetical protein SEVIR_8G053800v2 [Setaria viridis]TKV99592.1 hypothetical protein SEVIR_8G053800v2 [Setaria viridis]